MTVDAAGDLWVAIYGGGQVRRYSPEGVLREVLTVPARQSTCCAFAGPGLHRLYVTTATENWTDEQAQGRTGCRPGLPAGHRCHRPAGRSVPPGPRMVGGVHPLKVGPRVPPIVSRARAGWLSDQSGGSWWSRCQAASAWA